MHTQGINTQKTWPVLPAPRKLPSTRRLLSTIQACPWALAWGLTWGLTWLSTPIATSAAEQQPAASSSSADTVTGTSSTEDRIKQAFEAAQARAVKQQKDLVSYIKDTSNISWLKSTQGESFITLYRADQTGKSLGLVLLLHGEQQHPAAGPTLETLRTKLPEHGWATLSIGFLHDASLLRNLTDLSRPKTPTTATQASKDPTDTTTGTASTANTPSADANRNSTSENSPDNESNNKSSTGDQIIVPAFPALPLVSKNFQERLATTLPIISEKAPEHIAVIAFDISALWFFESINAGQSLPGLNFVVLIDGYQPPDYSAFDLIQGSISSPFSLLDIAISHPEAHIQSQLRRIRARQKQRQNYRHLKMTPTLNTTVNQANLIRRISKWLERQVLARQ